MANENIELHQPNFCLGPQIGTLCTIDTTNPQTVLRVKNTGGSTIIDLTLSSNILNDNVRLEYVGPSNLSSMVDDLIFFTFEKVNDSSCIVKRWATRMAYRELLLKEQVLKVSSGVNSYNAIDFAVESYNRRFDAGNENNNYLFINDVSTIKNGTRLFVGPSTNLDNLGATETAVVSHIADVAGTKWVFLTAPLKYKYRKNDLISLYSYVYIFTKEVVPGDSRQGSIIKLDAYTWQVKEKTSSAIYKRVTATRWCPMVGGIASVIGTNMLFVRPYDSYQNWRSMFLRNVKKDKNTTFEVYDVVFDQQKVYKLQKFTTLVEDDGSSHTYNWNYYNYQVDTLAPYSSSLALWLSNSIVTGHFKNEDINAQVRDQFHIALRDVTLNFYKLGDDEALFDPLSGIAVTDLNGKALMNYRSGSAYSGHTYITARATGGSNSTGSEFVWSSNNIISKTLVGPLYVGIFQKQYPLFRKYLRQVNNYFLVWGLDDLGHWDWIPIRTNLKALSYFTAPGGDWGSDTYNIGLSYVPIEQVKTFLPELYRGDQIHIDSPPQPDTGFGFTAWPLRALGSDKPYFWGNQITINEAFNSENIIKCITFYLKYPKGDLTGKNGYAPYVRLKQPDESGDVQLSQLKLSLHTHYVDGQPYDYLWTYDNIDQFIFVEDAIPKFWSKKNPIETDIWIRLRPFAFSLDDSTLRMWIGISSYLGNTGFIEITDNVEIDFYDAGGGNLGLEVLYNPPEDLPHGALVTIRIEVYDTAYIPNFIYVEYWFEVTPDYKAPYLTNLSPSREEINFPVDKPIYFEIKDIGTGIDMNSLEFLINSRLMGSDEVDIEVVSRHHIKVTYTPKNGLYFSKDYKIAAKATDLSPQQNRMNDSYTFYTRDSTGVYITDPIPATCKKGMRRFESVSAVVLADGNGVDLSTIKMQVYNKNVKPNIVPIVYRIS